MGVMKNYSLLHFLTSKAAALFLLLLIFIAGQTQMNRAQQPVAQDSSSSCTTQLANLNTCVPFVVPGASFNINSSMECCYSVQSLQKDCLCSTLRLAARIPASCKLPPIICTDR